MQESPSFAEENSPSGGGTKWNHQGRRFRTTAAAVLALVLGFLVYASGVSRASNDLSFASAPGEVTTGVPGGIELTPSASIKVTTPGATVEAMDVTGSIHVFADDVTITNSRIKANGTFYGVKIASGVTGLTIADSEISGAKAAAVSYGEYDAIRLDVHNSRDGFLAGSNVTIRDSWIHDLQSGGSAIRTVGGIGTVIVGNHVDLGEGSSGSGIQIRADNNVLENWLVQDNYLNGGKYSLYFDARRHDAVNIQFSGNLFRADSWGLWAASLKASPSAWSDNRTTNGIDVTTSRSLDQRFTTIEIPENEGPVRTGENTTTITSQPNLTVANPSTTVSAENPSGPDRNDVYLSFDGDNDFVTLGNLDVSGSQLTIEALVNAQGFANCRLNDCRVVSKATGTSPSQHTWMLSTIAVEDENRLRFRLNTGGSTKTLIATRGAVQTGSWHHIAATYDGSQMRLYLDGEEVGSTSMSGSIDQNPSVEAWIGGNPNSPQSRPWHGGIDEVRIWREARSQAEIAASMNGAAATGANLIAHYPITASSHVDDHAGNNDGRSGVSAEADRSDPAIASGQVQVVSPKAKKPTQTTRGTVAPAPTAPPQTEAPTTPPKNPTPVVQSPVGSATSVTQDGITWTFDRAYPTGQYINGDWWVVGPVTIVHISPEWDGTRHGSQVNPLPGRSTSGRPQGYHTSAPDFHASANAEMSMPLQLTAGNSLVSTIGWSTSDSGAPLWNGGLRPAVRAASVLTVVEVQPPNDAFRPQYGGGAKGSHRWSDVNMSLLPTLSRAGINTPSLADTNDRIARVFIDHVSYWNGRQIHPSDNTADYGRDLAVQMNEASLLLMLDYSDADKRELAISLIQRGIDLFGLLQEAPSTAKNGRFDGWWGDFGGGHGVGRKWPILFAGIMLDNESMKDAGRDYGPEFFQEDCQVRYGSSGVKMATWTGGGMEWGEFLCTRPNSEPSSNSPGYRTCCTGNAINGAALSVYLMDRHNSGTNAQELWNHPVFFDYMDYYMDELSFSDPWKRSFSGFMAEMWDTYR